MVDRSAIALVDAEIAGHRAAIRRLEAWRAEQLGENPCLAAAAPVGDTLAALRAECASRGIAVTADGFVAEANAGPLIGKSRKTLRRWRDESGRIRSRRLGGCVQLDLSSIATFLESAEEI